MVIAMMGLSSMASAKYTCKKTASGVCAQSVKTGQCTHSWNQDDVSNPMWHCKKFTGQIQSSFNKANYYCKKQSDYVCAASKKTGQCTHAWSKDDGGDPMWRCQKFLGLVKTNFDKSNFTCKKNASGYCAQSLKTGQCTHQWNNEDGNAKWQCNNWLKK